MRRLFTSICLNGNSIIIERWAANRCVKVHHHKSLTNENENVLYVSVLSNGYMVDNIFYASWESVLQENIFVPQVYINIQKQTDYTLPLSKLIENRRNYFKQCVNTFISHFENNFIKYFCPITGAIKIPDYEWVQITHPLKSLFESKIDNYFIYALETDDSILLRGISVYYYFATHSNSSKFCGWQIVDTWFNNTKKFLDDLKISFKKSERLNKNIPLYLAIFDNLRNIVLEYFKITLFWLYGNNEFIWHNKDNNSSSNLIVRYVNNINKYQDLFFSIIEEKGKIRPRKYIFEIIDFLITECEACRLRARDIHDLDLLKKLFFPLQRENDYYLENFLVLKQCTIDNTIDTDSVEFIGLMSGALELPFILSYIYNSNNLNIGLFYGGITNYNSRQMTITNRLQNFIEETNVKGNIVLLDDNIMCGYTLQHSINKLSILGYTVHSAWIIKYPDIGRVPQALYFGHCVNFNLVGKNIHGLYAPSNYTKIPPNKNLGNCFLNEQGIYSIYTDIIFKSIYKNGYFLPESEINIFNGYNSPSQIPLDIVLRTNQK